MSGVKAGLPFGGKRRQHGQLALLGEMFQRALAQRGEWFHVELGQSNYGSAAAGVFRIVGIETETRLTPRGRIVAMRIHEDWPGDGELEEQDDTEEQGEEEVEASGVQAIERAMRRRGPTKRS